MATKSLSIKFNEATLSYLSKKSAEFELHHKMSNDLPDYSATIRHMINLFKQYDEAGVSLPSLDNN